MIFPKLNNQTSAFFLKPTRERALQTTLILFPVKVASDRGFALLSQRLS